MALQSSGQIKLSEIQTEFGGSNPIAISEYYDAAAGIPSSGEIQLAADFYGTSNYQAITTSGGSVTTSGDYKFVTFTSSGTLGFTAASGAASNTVDYLVVAGGGNGSTRTGGGAGGMRTGTVSPSTASYTITVGGASPDSHGVGITSHGG